jgi:tetratricopeptide (TPR) repeat protein
LNIRRAIGTSMLGIAGCFVNTALTPSALAAVTPDAVLRVESREHGSHRKQMQYAVQLVNSLDLNTSNEVILDVLALQSQSWIDMGLADRIDKVLAAARDLARAVGDPMRIATVQHLTVRARYFTGDDRAAVAESVAALNAQRALGGDTLPHPDPTRLFKQSLDHVNMLQGIGSDVEAVPMLRLAERILPSVRNPTRHAIDLDYAYASLMLVLGDRESSLARLLAGLEKAVQVGETGWQAEIYGALATLHTEGGNIQEALAAAQKYRALSIEDQSRLGEANAEIRLADALISDGSLAEAAQAAKRAIEIYDGLDDSFNRADARRVYAYAIALSGDAKVARKWLAQSLEFREENATVNWSYLIARVRTAIALASRDSAMAREAMIEENKRGLLRDNFNRSIQTKALREYHEVNAREVQLESLRRESEERAAAIRRDQIRILWQRIAIVATLLLLAIVAIALIYFFKRSRILRRTADTDALTGVSSRTAILAYAES